MRFGVYILIALNTSFPSNFLSKAYLEYQQSVIDLGILSDLIAQARIDPLSPDDPSPELPVEIANWIKIADQISAIRSAFKTLDWAALRIAIENASEAKKQPETADEVALAEDQVRSYHKLMQTRPDSVLLA